MTGLDATWRCQSSVIHGTGSVYLETTEEGGRKVFRLLHKDDFVCTNLMLGKLDGDI